MRYRLAARRDWRRTTLAHGQAERAPRRVAAAAQNQPCPYATQVMAAAQFTACTVARRLHVLGDRAGLSTVTGKTATFAAYLERNLQRIACCANNEVRRIGRGWLMRSGRRQRHHEGAMPHQKLATATKPRSRTNVVTAPRVRSASVAEHPDGTADFAATTSREPTSSTAKASCYGVALIRHVTSS